MDTSISQPSSTVVAPPATSRSSARLTSLDVFRGATIAGMILVNNPGSWTDVYAQLRHAAWSGYTFTDMIFPFFLFIVGVAMTFSFARRVEQGANKGALIGHAARRAAIIFALGLFVNGFPFGLFGSVWSLDTWRIPGVLQRIAICYFIATLIFLYSGVRAQIAWTVGFLVAYWLAVFLIPVPGYGAGFLEPKGNLLWWVDSHLLAGHTWVWAPAPGFDPEGILSTVPAISTTLFGILAGHWLRSARPASQKAGMMIAAGIVLLVVAHVLSIWLPFNKNMWTSSYAVLMAGWASLFLGLLFWIVDVRGSKGWAAPFVIFGMNAIVVYVASELLATLLGVFQTTGPTGARISIQEYVYRSWFAPIAGPANTSLLYALVFVGLMFLLAWGLWKKRWFLKV